MLRLLRVASRTNGCSAKLLRHASLFSGYDKSRISSWVRSDWSSKLYWDFTRDKRQQRVRTVGTNSLHDSYSKTFSMMCKWCFSSRHVCIKTFVWFCSTIRNTLILLKLITFTVCQCETKDNLCMEKQVIRSFLSTCLHFSSVVSIFNENRDM